MKPLEAMASLRKKESKKQLRERVLVVLKILKKTYPDAHCALNHKNAFELLIATILSAQCTDERVNLVTPQLFKKFPNAKALSKAKIEDLEIIIHSTGFYKNKSKNILACCKSLVSMYDGEVPSTLEELRELSGVGRKTANVVLGNIFGIPSMVVDTHVTRLSGRLGFTQGTDAVRLEFALQELVPKEDWTMYSHYIISHGRSVCKARNPDCRGCVINDVCPRMGIDR